MTRPVEAAGLVAGKIPPGTQIYVLGDPRIIALLHAVPGAEVAGWSAALPPIVWAELTRELDRSRPRFVFADGRDWSYAIAGRPVFHLLATQYRVIARSADGTWYETDHPGQPLPEPGGNQMYRHPALQ